MKPRVRRDGNVWFVDLGNCTVGPCETWDLALYVVSVEHQTRRMVDAVAALREAFCGAVPSGQERQQ